MVVLPPRRAAAEAAAAAVLLCSAILNKRAAFCKAAFSFAAFCDVNLRAIMPYPAAMCVIATQSDGLHRCSMLMVVLSSCPERKRSKPAINIVRWIDEKKYDDDDL